MYVGNGDVVTPGFDRKELMAAAAGGGPAETGFQLLDYRPCSPDHPEKVADVITVRRSFSEESVEVLRDMAETTQQTFPAFRPLYESGHGVSLFDVRDARYAFVYLGKSALDVQASVAKALDDLPRELVCGLGYGILLGASPDIKRQARYVGVSLDAKAHNQLTGERIAIMKSMGIPIQDIEERYTHTSLLKTRRRYAEAVQAANRLNNLAAETDRYVEQTDDPSLKLILGKPEVMRGGLRRKSATR